MKGKTTLSVSELASWRASDKFSGVIDPVHAQKFVVGTWEILCVIVDIPIGGRVKQSEQHNLNVYAHRKSDKGIVVTKQANKVTPIASSNMELSSRSLWSEGP